MKAKSGTLAFLVLAVIVVVAILMQLRHGHRRSEFRFGDPDAPQIKYVELKNGLADEGKFHDALATLKSNGGDCQIYFLRHANDPKPIFNYCDQIPARLKTDKITKSEAANDARREESTTNDPHATYRIASPHPEDIKAVTDLLKLH